MVHVTDRADVAVRLVAEKLFLGHQITFALARRLLGNWGDSLTPDGRLERVAGIEPASSAWKAAALPLCYTRAERLGSPVLPKCVIPDAFKVGFIMRGGGSRTRTYEGLRQRIYSPPPLPLGTFPRAG